jgi:NAD(P)-dependent dehydrogenase (short-subunit alcohol dehydrogenase family)
VGVGAARLLGGEGSVAAFTRSLSQALAARSIRVNAVAPGPVWTLLIPASSPRGSSRASAPACPWAAQEIARSFVFLASDNASYITGQVLHPNGGEIISG